MPQPPQGPNGQAMVPIQQREMTPAEERVNLAFIVLERVKPSEGCEHLEDSEVSKLRAQASKVIREHLESPIPTEDYEKLWKQQIATA